MQIITQRFKLPAQDGNGEVEVDVECNNRFVFFCLKNAEGEWKAQYYKGEHVHSLERRCHIADRVTRCSQSSTRRTR